MANFEVTTEMLDRMQEMKKKTKIEEKLESDFFGNFFLTEDDRQKSSLEETTYKVPFQDLKRKYDENVVVCEEGGSLTIVIKSLKSNDGSPTKKIKLNEMAVVKEKIIEEIIYDQADMDIGIFFFNM